MLYQSGYNPCLKLWGHLISFNLWCHVCTGNTWRKSLSPTVRLVVINHDFLMIITRCVWLELSQGSIAVAFNIRGTRSILCGSFQRLLGSIGYGSRRTLASRKWTLRLTWARVALIGYWRTSNLWRGPMCYGVSWFVLGADARILVWHKAHESMNPSCQQGTMKSHGSSIIPCFRF